MNEVIINTNEIESIWEKDNLCFIGMKSGKVWICDEKQIVESYLGDKVPFKTSSLVIKKSREGGLVKLTLSKMGKSEDYGKK